MRPRLATAMLMAAGAMAAFASASDTATRAAQRLIEVSATRTGAQPQPGTPAPERASNADTRRQRGSGIGRILRGAPWPSREGWTNARYRRAARKARNVQRNRKAHRG